MLRSCPALLQGFLASCRSHGGVGSCERHLDSCVAVLHHVALARQYDVELCRLVTTAWMRRETWMSLGIWWMLSCEMFYLFFLDAGGDEPSGFVDLFDVVSSDRFGFLVLMPIKQSLAHWLVGAYLIFSLLTQLFCCCPICLFPSIYAWSGFGTKQLRDCDAIGGTLWPRGCHIQSVTATVDHAGTFVPAGVSSTGDLWLRVVAIAVLSAVLTSFVVRFAATVEQ